MPFLKNLTTADVLRRSLTRILFCTLPFLIVAWLYTYYMGNTSLFQGFPFWLCVVIIPVFGLVIDLWRLRGNFS